MNPRSDAELAAEARNAEPQIGDVDTVCSAALSETRPFYWSVRRELWENRSLYLAPLAVTAVVLFALLIWSFGLPHRIQALGADATAEQRLAVIKPFSMAPAVIMLTSFLVGLFYSVDALYGERRDRSILFWKSLPVSDLTTVLSKATIPCVVLPLIAFLLSVGAVLLLLFLSVAVLLAGGVSPAVFLADVGFLERPVIMLYGLTVHALWFAPLHGWLLLISVWARRSPLLWVALPPVAISVVERILFNTTHFVSLLQYRLTGAMTEAFAGTPRDGHGMIIDRFSQLSPLRFLASPGLWIGLIFAGACLAAAVRLRRRREPI
jgi:ABC-2 type transport system permease protein